MGSLVLVFFFVYGGVKVDFVVLGCEFGIVFGILLLLLFLFEYVFEKWEGMEFIYICFLYLKEILGRVEVFIRKLVMGLY